MAWRDRVRRTVTLHSLRRTGVVTVQFFCAIHLFSATFYEACLCDGASMYPTVQPTGDRVLLRRCSRADPLRNIERGDIVAAASPAYARRVVCKRLLGMPGDTIWVDPTGESGVGPTDWIKVPPGHVWLVGDNPSNSLDSRYYGPVSINLLRGYVVARLWPRPGLWHRDVEQQSIP